MGDGPYIHIALPELWVEYIPVNATGLLREWEASLDPTRTVAESGHQLWEYRRRWVLSDRFVEPSSSTLARIRDVGADEAVIDRFENSVGRLFDSSEAETGHHFSKMVSRDLKRYVLSDIALPVLLGLAVLAAVSSAHGYYGRQVARAMGEASSDTQAER